MATLKDSDKNDHLSTEFPSNTELKFPNSETFMERLLEFYPTFLKKEIESNKTILLSGIDYSKLNMTEACYFLKKEPQFKENLNATIYGDAKETGQKQIELEDPAAQKSEYCICKKGSNGTSDNISIQCDNCNEWYHQFCIKMSKREVEFLNQSNEVKWFCFRCLK